MSKFGRLSEALISWYGVHKRDLPWRRVRDPYAILVSEVMLQQTQVATVLPYYERFLRRFPDVRALGEAEESEVLALWSGLGYYRRGRALHQAARKILHEHGGKFPTTYEQILVLPGVGRYSAGAVGSFAFGLRLPIVEANSARVLARVFALRLALKGSLGQRRLWEYAEQLLPEHNAREHNYALMELGALVCTPLNPACESCPLREGCRAYKEGVVEEIPLREPRKQIVRKCFAGAIVECEGKLLVRRIAPGEWHAGLYEFPKVEVELDAEEKGQLGALRSMLQERCEPADFAWFAELSYAVTHHRVSLRLWRVKARVKAAGQAVAQAEWVWLALGEIKKLPLGSAQRKILHLLQEDDFFQLRG